MTDTTDRPFEIAGPQEDWLAEQAVDRLAGPSSLMAAGLPAMHGLSLQIDDVDDRMAVVESMRLTHKAGETVLRGSGYFPFGAEPRLTWTNRYADSRVRSTVDLKLHRGVALKQGIQLGSLTLPGEWREIRLHGRDGAIDTWQLDADASDYSYDGHPLYAVAIRADGLELEIGTGGDLWRWDGGVMGSGNVGCWRLLRQDDGWRLERWITVAPASAAETGIEPDARTYRFSHYLAWRQPGNDPQPQFPDPLVANWRPNGDLALRQLGDLQPGQALCIDLDTLDCPDHLRRDHTPTHFCLASPRVQKRLKRVIRQILALDDRDFPILLRHMQPGCCGVASHVDRKGTRPHWDVGGLMDLAGWIRAQLGPEQVIVLADPPADWPLAHIVFRPEPPLS